MNAQDRQWDSIAVCTLPITNSLGETTEIENLTFYYNIELLNISEMIEKIYLNRLTHARTLFVNMLMSRYISNIMPYPRRNTKLYERNKVFSQYIKRSPLGKG